MRNLLGLSANCLQPPADPSQGMVAGVTLCLTSCIFTDCGLIMEKVAISGAAKGGGDLGDVKFWKLKKWWAGFILFLVGQVLFAVSLSQASTLILLPLGGFTLVVNVINSVIFLKEGLGIYDVISTVLIIGGSVLSALYGPSVDSSPSIPCIVQGFTQEEFYLPAIFFVLSQLVIYVLAKRVIERVRREKRKENIAEVACVSPVESSDSFSSGGEEVWGGGGGGIRRDEWRNFSVILEGENEDGSSGASGGKTKDFNSVTSGDDINNRNNHGGFDEVSLHHHHDKENSNIDVNNTNVNSNDRKSSKDAKPKTNNNNSNSSNSNSEKLGEDLTFVTDFLPDSSDGMYPSLDEPNNNNNNSSNQISSKTSKKMAIEEQDLHDYFDSNFNGSSSSNQHAPRRRSSASKYSTSMTHASDAIELLESSKSYKLSKWAYPFLSGCTQVWTIFAGTIISRLVSEIIGGDMSIFKSYVLYVTLAIWIPLAATWQNLVSQALLLLDARYAIPADFTVQVLVNMVITGTFFDEFKPQFLPRDKLPFFLLGVGLSVLGVLVLGVMSGKTGEAGSSSEKRDESRKSRTLDDDEIDNNNNNDNKDEKTKKKKQQLEIPDVVDDDDSDEYEYVSDSDDDDDENNERNVEEQEKEGLLSKNRDIEAAVGKNGGAKRRRRRKKKMSATKEFLVNYSITALESRWMFGPIS